MKRKLSVFARLSNLMRVAQRKALMKSFNEAEFGYCPLALIFLSREVNRTINHIHERSRSNVCKRLQ